MRHFCFLSLFWVGYYGMAFVFSTGESNPLAEGAESTDGREDLDAKQESVIETIRGYLRARLDKDANKLERLMHFPPVVDVNAFRGKVTKMPSLEVGVDLSKRIYIVSAPASYGTGDYLFLYGTRDGYFYRKLAISYAEVGKTYRINYAEQEFQGKAPNSQTAVQQAINNVREKLEKWRLLEGQSLAKEVEAFKSGLREQIVVLEYAKKNKLTVVSGFGTLEDRKKALAEVNDLSAEQFRLKVVSELEKLLASMQ